MPSRGQPLTISYLAWDTINEQGLTGDAANQTLRWIKDGSAVTPTATIGEISSSIVPGIYTVAITSTDTTCSLGMLAGTTSSSGGVIVPLSLTFELLPTTSAGFSGGLPLVGNQIPTGSAGHTTAGLLTPTSFTALSDTFLDRDMSLGADSGSATTRTVRQALRFLRNKWTLTTAGTLVVCKEDDITTSWTALVSTNSSAVQIVGNDPAG